MAKSLHQNEVDKFEDLGVGESAVQIINMSSLVPSVYDFIDLDYTGNNLTTVTYKTGGSGGTTVATLTITYTSTNHINTITKA